MFQLEPGIKILLDEEYLNLYTVCALGTEMYSIFLTGLATQTAFLSHVESVKMMVTCQSTLDI